MTYGTKYRAGWQSKDLQGYLYIKEKDYSGAITDVVLQDDAIAITNNFEDTESPIIGLRCEFYILNNKDDYFELFELLTATEQKFKVNVSVTAPYTATAFEGFMNVDTISHGYLHNQVMRLVASSYLSKLEYLTPASILTRQNVTFIDLINEILVGCGAAFDIRVNCSMYATGDTLSSGKTLFNLNGITTEAFWDSDTERKNSLEILEAILLPLNCFLYWWDGYWYIEHFTDIWRDKF